MKDSAISSSSIYNNIFEGIILKDENKNAIIENIKASVLSADANQIFTDQSLEMFESSASGGSDAFSNIEDQLNNIDKILRLNDTLKLGVVNRNLGNEVIYFVKTRENKYRIANYDYSQPFDQLVFEWDRNEDKK